MSDRILVMHEGKVAGEIADPASASQEDVMRLATGSSKQSLPEERGVFQEVEPRGD
jgi:ABC-type uncharacterized transport system ATPase subunit